MPTKRPHTPIQLPDHILRERAEIARRLKAARWLAGEITKKDKGQVAHQVTPLPASELCDREPLKSNGIGPDIIGRAERMERTTRPYELKLIAEAIGVAPGWFELATPLDAAASLLQGATQAAQEPDPKPGASAADDDEPGRPGQAGEGAGA